MNPPQKSLEELLQDALSVNRDIRQPTETAINNLAKENLSLFLTKLGEILYSEQKTTPIRQMSAILFKNILIRDPENISTYLTKISAEEKKNIRELVLGSLASNFKEIRTITSTLIASICEIEKPIEQKWPELLSSLTGNCFNDNLNLKLSAIETLGYVCEELSIKDISEGTLTNILNALVGNLKDNINNKDVIEYSIKAFTNCIRICEKYFGAEKERNIIMDAIFNIIKQYQNQDDILDKIALLFIEMLSRSNFYDYLEFCMPQILEFSFYLIKNKSKENERLALLGLEIFLTLGVEEEKRDSKPIQTIETNVIFKGNSQPQNSQFPLQQSKKYFDKISGHLQGMIIEYVKVEKEDEEDSEWNLSKGCLYILAILVKVCDLRYVTEFFKKLEDQIKMSIDNQEMRCKCWLLLSSAVNSKNRDISLKMSSCFINNMMNDIAQNNSPVLQNCASFLLKKVTELFPKVVDDNKIDAFFNVLLSTLKQTNSSTIGINVCHIIRNMIVRLGDPQTKKAQCPLSNYFVKLLQGLFVTAEMELVNQKDEYGKLSFSRLMTIETLISYSSHDKQNNLKEILLQYLQQIEFTQKNYSQLIARGIKEEKIKQLQDYYYTLLRSILMKYQKPIEVDLAKNIWTLTDSIFKTRKTVFEEANIAFGALAANMKEDFTVLFETYYPFLQFSITKFDEANLSRSGLSTLLTIIRVIKNGITSKSEDILKVLLQVCTSNNVTRANKTIAISCIGDVAICLGKSFKIYVKDVTTLLFSACQLAVSQADEEEEGIQFIKDLRFEIIQAFTCISFSLEEEVNLLVPYIPNIFTFFKAIVNDRIRMREDIYLSMMNFVGDMINAFGTEMKPLCDQQFLKNIIENVKSYGNEKNNDDINQMENVFSLLFIQ